MTGDNITRWDSYKSWIMMADPNFQANKRVQFVAEFEKVTSAFYCVVFSAIGLLLIAGSFVDDYGHLIWPEKKRLIFIPTVSAPLTYFYIRIKLACRLSHYASLTSECDAELRNEAMRFTSYWILFILLFSLPANILFLLVGFYYSTFNTELDLWPLYLALSTIQLVSTVLRLVCFIIVLQFLWELYQLGKRKVDSNTNTNESIISS